MKNNIISGFGAFLCISALAYINSFDESNLWLIPPFGASMVLVMAVHESPLAHPKNVFFGHLLTALVGIIFVNYIPLPIYINIALAVGAGVSLMILFNVVHPPAGGNPIIVIIGSASYDYLINPIIFGCIILLLLAIVINKYLLKKNYPLK